MINNLKDIGLEDKMKFGGKAVCLGELLKQGIRVPNGFALSSCVFNEILEYNGFPYNEEEYLACNEEICKFIMQCIFPPELKKEIKKNFDALSIKTQASYFVVRSSALCEDSDSYSFAGIFDSFDHLITSVLTSK